MRRSLLATMTVLGALICLVGSTGLFAALTDSATTGTNTVTSDGLPTSIDIKLATADEYVGWMRICSTMADDLVTPLITESALQPGAGGSRFFCLRNDGAQTATDLTVRAFDLTDTDDACTGDEADSGDVSCGGGGAGELSQVLSVTFGVVECQDYTIETWSTGEIGLDANVSADLTLPALPAGATMCVQAYVAYRVPEDPLAAQLAQSDTVTWRFRFTAAL